MFLRWFLSWRQDHEKSDCPMLSHSIYIAYPSVHKTYFSLFQSVFMSLLDLVWFNYYFNWFCPSLFCLFADQYQWSNWVQFQCHDNTSLVAVFLLILSTFQYMRSSSVNLPNFHRNIILCSDFSFIASGCNKKHYISLRYLLLFQTT